MTMGYRNRRSPSNARAGEMSPTTGRFVVAAVGVLSIGMAYWSGSMLFYVIGIMGAIGLLQAIFNPKIFGDGW